ncbi:2-amino-4-hydroxy-6-hydroxymethyldihydropteridine diphosphokinase [Pelotomaculum terephthalicicum JT]|uniref:2-amino-4-hydroxy-6- hydroxymethyldihydropteridine diphosphokinase n=1 Tax=Pelotomaculum TaxID=191373 RepID=UPI0009C62D9A|nr:MULTISPECIES: 2-amino-4-hydroxy-6-hydroxymethyldihydropteridine diphosphokinase [Pelotomaculum]MCG9968291.1 2-amino-4-hydroxy-6-hydroxymethyldihydropteridine diphosphokinase [Pelotomaculum terephthalicicum JT]OPX89504.1 MAG: Bifunctional folate synthesis protein [Pelotomaculum sp. PtaB.Bin117]OPY63261.1 MAG: Bifunctional folate synthesis protein [Pelotomaculum sp. PtaU1.Bin065]
MNNSLLVVAYVGLGSNVGDKAANISKALNLLGAAPGLRVVRVAPCYRTAPIGYAGQDWFINTVAEVETDLPPLDLLRLLLALEDRLGRVRGRRWGPRTIDLDLLVYDKVAIDTPELVIPHPRMHERAFVMAPLADLAPGLVIPGRGKAEGLALSLAKAQLIERMANNI